MELRQLKYFVTIFEQGGFSKAAVTLNIAQSALSTSVKKMEDELGITLINRNERTLALTLEGEAFIEKAKSILGQVEGLYQEMEEYRGVVRGELHIGIPGMLATHYFPNVLDTFRAQYPGLRITVYSEGSKKLEEMLLKKQLDLAIIADDHLPEAIEWQLLLEDEIVACVSSNHRLAMMENITIEELAKEPLFLFCKGNYQRAVLERKFDALGFTPNVSFETNLTTLLKNVTANGGGLCTLLSMAVDRHDLTAIPIKPALKVRAGIAWMKKSYLSLAAQAFIEHLKNQDK